MLSRTYTTLHGIFKQLELPEGDCKTALICNRIEAAAVAGVMDVEEYLQGRPEFYELCDSDIGRVAIFTAFVSANSPKDDSDLTAILEKLIAHN